MTFTFLSLCNRLLSTPLRGIFTSVVCNRVVTDYSAGPVSALEIFDFIFMSTYFYFQFVSFNLLINFVHLLFFLMFDTSLAPQFYTKAGNVLTLFVYFVIDFLVL